ncbi:MAG TPA: gluconeogenesis factor YvcK family protein [Dehalococcoidia bacterium]
MRGLIRDPSFIKWFYFGMHIKRWLLLLLLGVCIMGLGFGYFLREVYVSYHFPAFMYYVTLQFLPRLFRGILFVCAAFGLIGFSVWKLNSSLLSAFIKPERNESIVDIIYNHRYLRRGPKIVAIGGGTGLSTLLRGLKEYTGNITAIVSIADDGGSSGRLQRELGVLPPGDIRKNIAALADAEPLMSRLFEYRFEEGEGLGGHSFGNLFIVAMTEVAGNFEEAVRETSRVLAVRGQILPATLSALTICARTDDGTVVRGESSITEHGHVKEVFLDPPTIQANPDAIRAILQADLIVCGPGSLMTSVLPNMLVEGIRRAIEVSPALKIYVCNVATQHGETDDFRVSDHYKTLKEHLKGNSPFDYVLANSNTDAVLPEAWHSQPVKVDEVTLNGARVVGADVVDAEHRYRHDSKKLADALIRLYYERHQIAEPERAPATPEVETAPQHAGVG